MNHRLLFSCFLVLVLFSCKNETEKRLIETEKDAKKKEIIFSNINKGWVFNSNPINTTSQANASSWNEWRLFLAELNEKPKKTIGAFQKKAIELSKKAMKLDDNIPYELSKPQIKGRIAALITKVRLLDLFIHLDNIPDQKVIGLVSDINVEMISLQNQMDKLFQKSKIPLEEGESDLIKMLDTTRAIPTLRTDLNRSRVE